MHTYITEQQKQASSFTSKTHKARNRLLFDPWGYLFCTAPPNSPGTGPFATPNKMENPHPNIYVPDDHPRSRIPEKDGREGGGGAPVATYPFISARIKYRVWGNQMARHNDLVRRDKVADQICPICPNLPKHP